MLYKIKRILYPYAKAVARKFLVPMASKGLWKQIKREKSPDTLVFVSFFSIGDLLYCLSFLKAIKQIDPSKKIVVIALKKYESIVETFDSYDQVVFIPNSGRLWFRVKSLVANLGYADQLFQDGIIIEPYGIMALTKDFGKKRIDYITAKRQIFGLRKDTPIDFHRLLPAEVSCIPDFDKIHKRVVVLNPYSVSAQLGTRGVAFFEQVCALLKEKGYFVYTNVTQDQKPIKGSRALKCSLEEMLGIANQIPLIVSLRSGILDLLVPTHINMFVIYNRLLNYIWYKMENWNSRGMLQEIFYEEADGETERLMALFREYLADLNL